MKNLLIAFGLAALVACGSNWIIPVPPEGSGGGDEPGVVTPTDPGPGCPLDPVDPGDGGSDPGDGGEDPGDGGSDPGDGGSDPGDGGSDPGDGGSDPGDGGSDPGDGGSDPGDGGSSDNSCKNGKIAVCHFPQGNTSNPQSICVATEALVNAHLAHGDYLGACN